MSVRKQVPSESLLLTPNSDPLRIKGIALGGDPPSLEIEALIANRRWAAQNGGIPKRKKNERTNRET